MINEIHPHQLDNRYQANHTITENDYIFRYSSNALLIKNVGDTLEIPVRKDFPQITENQYLFRLNGISCFLVFDELQADHPDFEFKNISFFRTLKKPDIAWASMLGQHLDRWYSEHQFCGKCGTKALHKQDERALLCPNCATLYFPRISPAVIVAITCRDKILLARNSSFPGAWYALIAGYVDVGETLEETVIREVKEEVGLDVTNIRYCINQPWPLTGSMMIGFTAEADENQPIRVDGKEIVEAAWFTRGNLPEHPKNISISGELIERFEKGEL